MPHSITTSVALPILVPAPTPVPIQTKQEVEMVQPVAVAVTSVDHTALLINSSFQLATLVVTIVLAEIMRRIKKKNDELDKKAAEAAVERVKLKETIASTTEASLIHRAEETIKQDETLKIVNTIHKLVNSDMHTALQTAASLAGRISVLTGTVEDKLLAEKAQQKVTDHDAGEAKVAAAEASAVRPLVERRVTP